MKTISPVGTKQKSFMSDTNQRVTAEIVFERNQRREAEISGALKQEAARRDAVLANMYCSQALRLARATRSKIGAPNGINLQTFQ
jgi:hypothetical protein